MGKAKDAIQASLEEINDAMREPLNGATTQRLLMQEKEAPPPKRRRRKIDPDATCPMFDAEWYVKKERRR